MGFHGWSGGSALGLKFASSKYGFGNSWLQMTLTLGEIDSFLKITIRGHVIEFGHMVIQWIGYFCTAFTYFHHSPFTCKQLHAPKCHFTIKHKSDSPNGQKYYKSGFLKIFDKIFCLSPKIEICMLFLEFEYI